MLQKIRDDYSLECSGFRILFPTRWTVRANTLKRILDSWAPINSKKKVRSRNERKNKSGKIRVFFWY